MTLLLKLSQLIDWLNERVGKGAFGKPEPLENPFRFYAEFTQQARQMNKRSDTNHPAWRW